ncbi:MAG: glycine betaine ABC transporter substrate-binding protein [Spirochaetia bacterium]|nr:glycine betaine ABC transporter substrate-binding protein [Spirochaetia bacterium]
MKNSVLKNPLKSGLLVGATLLTTLLLAALLIGCGREDSAETIGGSQDTSRADTEIRLVYPEWSSEIASAQLIQAVLEERLGYRVRMTPVEVGEMWRRVAEGEADVLTGAWLPTTHQGYYQEFRGQLEDLGPNLVGARIGLVVPTVRPGRQTDASGKTGRELVTIRSIEELSGHVNKFDGRITGIESGAGVVARTQKALTAYNLQAEYHVITGDEARMLSRLRRAVQQGEWIVITGWRPHWIFELYNLRFLEDPKGVFGGEESIHTMVRPGLQEDAPDAYRVLKQISYKPEDLERLMRWIQEDDAQDPYAQAVRWIKLHSEMVDSWVKAAE